MLDHYIAGKTERISPEAPVPVVQRERSWTVPGGAANVARCLTRLGCHTRLLGIIGADSAGDSLRKEVASEKVEGALIESSRPTTCKTRIMAHGQQLLRLDEERIAPPTLEEMTALRTHMEHLMAGASALILSDYGKGALLRDKNGATLCQNAIALAKDAAVPILVDPKGTDWMRYAGADCVTPNTGEFRTICEGLAGQRLNLVKLDEEAKLRQELADNICMDFQLARILLTRGPKGMNLFTPGQKPLHIRATRREVADVSGAGDTVIATLAACVAAGMTWDESARIANIAAGIAVGKLGTAPVSLVELEKALGSGRDNPKLFTREEAQDQIREWRRLGQSIVFTNGCFDLLHPGHISLLKQSAAMGDRLIVGLNSDASVRRLKGKERPLQNQESRATLLAALHDVDGIVIFDEDTPEELIKLLEPDCLVKGNDYKIEDVVGADFVRSRGGRVKLVDIVNGCSTTGLVRKMRENR